MGYINVGGVKLFDTKGGRESPSSSSQTPEKPTVSSYKTAEGQTVYVSKTSTGAVSGTAQDYQSSSSKSGSQSSTEQKQIVQQLASQQPIVVNKNQSYEGQVNEYMAKKAGTYGVVSVPTSQLIRASNSPYRNLYQEAGYDQQQTSAALLTPYFASGKGNYGTPTQPTNYLMSQGVQAYEKPQGMTASQWGALTYAGQQSSAAKPIATSVSQRSTAQQIADRTWYVPSGSQLNVATGQVTKSPVEEAPTPYVTKVSSPAPTTSMDIVSTSDATTQFKSQSPVLNKFTQNQTFVSNIPEEEQGALGRQIVGVSDRAINTIAYGGSRNIPENAPSPTMMILEVPSKIGKLGATATATVADVLITSPQLKKAGYQPSSIKQTFEFELAKSRGETSGKDYGELVNKYGSIALSGREQTGYEKVAYTAAGIAGDVATLKIPFGATSKTVQGVGDVSRLEFVEVLPKSMEQSLYSPLKSTSYKWAGETTTAVALTAEEIAAKKTIPKPKSEAVEQVAKKTAPEVVEQVAKRAPTVVDDILKTTAKAPSKSKKRLSVVTNIGDSSIMGVKAEQVAVKEVAPSASRGAQDILGSGTSKQASQDITQSLSNLPSPPKQTVQGVSNVPTEIFYPGTKNVVTSGLDRGLIKIGESKPATFVSDIAGKAWGGVKEFGGGLKNIGVGATRDVGGLATKYVVDPLGRIKPIRATSEFLKKGVDDLIIVGRPVAKKVGEGVTTGKTIAKNIGADVAKVGRYPIKVIDYPSAKAVDILKNVPYVTKPLTQSRYLGATTGAVISTGVALAEVKAVKYGAEKIQTKDVKEALSEKDITTEDIIIAAQRPTMEQATQVKDRKGLGNVYEWGAKGLKTGAYMFGTTGDKETFRAEARNFLLSKGYTDENKINLLVDAAERNWKVYRATQFRQLVRAENVGNIEGGISKTNVLYRKGLTQEALEALPTSERWKVGKTLVGPGGAAEGAIAVMSSRELIPFEKPDYNIINVKTLGEGQTLDKSYGQFSFPGGTTVQPFNLAIQFGDKVYSAGGATQIAVGSVAGYYISDLFSGVEQTLKPMGKVQLTKGTATTQPKILKSGELGASTLGYGLDFPGEPLGDIYTGLATGGKPITRVRTYGVSPSSPSISTNIQSSISKDMSKSTSKSKDTTQQKTYTKDFGFSDIKTDLKTDTGVQDKGITDTTSQQFVDINTKEYTEVPIKDFADVPSKQYSTTFTPPLLPFVFPNIQGPGGQGRGVSISRGRTKPSYKADFQAMVLGQRAPQAGKKSVYTGTERRYLEAKTPEFKQPKMKNTGMKMPKGRGLSL